MLKGNYARRLMQCNPKRITATQCVALTDREFVSQTVADENGKYKMIWKSEDKLYYTKHKL